MEEEKVLTTEEVRETALKKLQDSLNGFSIDASDSGETAEGIAAMYREIMNDELTRKKTRWEIILEGLKAGGAALWAGGTVWAFIRATAKEKDGEIFDTLTKQTVVRNFLAQLFRRH